MITDTRFPGRTLRPILFQTEMVRAILEGRKLQTRRTVKGTPLEWINDFNFTPEFVSNLDNSLCPYGKPGDILWVRETFSPFITVGGELKKPISYIYQTDGIETGVKWKPSLHMPYTACRLWLEVVDIKVQRLQDISEDDAVAEGGKWANNGIHALHPSWKKPGWSHLGETHPDRCHETAKQSFANLWDKINGPESWNENPWVWVIQFKNVTPQ